MIEKSKSIVLFSKKVMIHEVEGFVEDICDEFNIFNSYFGNILLCVTEAFQNARVHGNKNDETKRIKITFESLPLGLYFRIEDEGEGFNFEPYLDQDFFPEENSSGNGLFLIKSLSDELHFYNNGKCIEIVFYISSINLDKLIERVKHLDGYFKKSEVEKPTETKE